MGIDTEQFGAIRLNLLAMEPLPNRNKAYSAVLGEEGRELLTKVIYYKTVVESLGVRGNWR